MLAGINVPVDCGKDQADFMVGVRYTLRETANPDGMVPRKLGQTSTTMIPTKACSMRAALGVSPNISSQRGMNKTGQGKYKL